MSLSGNNLHSADNFLQFGHETINSTNNITLCLRNKDSIQYSSHLSYKHITNKNAKIIFGECLPPQLNDYEANFDLKTAEHAMKFVYNEAGDHDGKTLKCITNSSTESIELCDMYCNETASCLGSTIIIDKPYTNLMWLRGRLSTIICCHIK